jgi:metal-sulfur cluster biosynthetic enzyme
MTAGETVTVATGEAAVRRDECASSRPDLVRETYRVLDEIYDPCSVASSVPMGLAEMGVVKSVVVTETGRVVVTLRLTSPFCEMISFMRTESVRRVEALDGVSECVVDHDSGFDWDDDMIAPAAAQRRRLRIQAVRREYESSRGALEVQQ